MKRSPLAAVMPGSSVARSATGMGLASALSRGLGFVRVIVVAAILGTTYLGNTFQSANGVSNVVFELVAAGALSAILVPGFTRHFLAGETERVTASANALLGLATLVLGVIAIIGMVASRSIATMLVAQSPDPSIRSEQVELATFLLRFFMPQVVLYAFGALAIAVLQARRKFLIGAVAPMASSVVMILLLIWFRMRAGSNPTLPLTFDEQILLAAAGTLSVVAFVAVPVIAVWRDGIALRPSLRWRDSNLRQIVTLSSWVILLHAGFGILMGAALIAGNGVAGGVVAFQVAWTFFLAPYAVFAQPIHTAVLPELSEQHEALPEFAGHLRWALDTTTRLLIPIAFLGCAAALPAMRVLAFGGISESGSMLMGVALAILLLGLPGYSMVFLATRAFFALHEARAAAVTITAAAIIGGGAMLTGVELVSGTAVIAVVAAAQSITVTCAAIGLWWLLQRRLAESLAPRMLAPATLVSIPLALLVAAVSYSTWSLRPFVAAGSVGLVAALCVATYLALSKRFPSTRTPAAKPVLS